MFAVLPDRVRPAASAKTSTVRSRQNWAPNAITLPLGKQSGGPERGRASISRQNSCAKLTRIGVPGTRIARIGREAWAAADVAQAAMLRFRTGRTKKQKTNKTKNTSIR